MKIDYKIFCPSYKRAGDIKAFKLFGDKLILVVSESEEKEYRKNYPNNEYLILPDEVQGNMSRVRNYIKDNCKTKYLVMVDDDIKSINYLENRKLNKMSIDEIDDFIKNGFIMCEELGTVYWGVNTNSDPMSYREFEPFLLRNPILAPFSCYIVNEKSRSIRFDEKLSLNEDYDYFLQVIKKCKIMLRFQKYNYSIGDFLTTKGGCSTYRTWDREEYQAGLMIKKWGDKIVRYDFKSKKFNPQIKLP